MSRIRHRNKKGPTYTREILARKRLVRTLIDIKRVCARAPAPLRSGHTRLAKIERANTRAGVDDLNDNLIPLPTNGRAIECAVIGHRIAQSAIVLWAGGANIAADWALTCALTHVDVGKAGTTRNVGGDVAGGCAKGPRCTLEGLVKDLTML